MNRYEKGLALAAGVSPIVIFWGCWGEVEHNASITLAYGIGQGAGFVPGVLLRSLFGILPGEPDSARFTAFRGNWGVESLTLQVEGVDIEVFAAPASWGMQVYLALFSGAIEPNPARCTELIGYGHPP